MRRDFEAGGDTGGADREVVQYQFTSWPIHGVPDDPIIFLDFIHKVSDTML